MGMSHGNESSGKIVIFSRVLWKDIFVCVHQIKIITIAIDHQAQFQEHSCLFRNISYFHNDSWTLFRVTFILPSVLLFEYFHGQFSCFFFHVSFLSHSSNQIILLSFKETTTDNVCNHT